MKIAFSRYAIADITFLAKSIFLFHRQVCIAYGFYQERLREVSQKHQADEKLSVKQHETMLRYQNQARILEEKLKGAEMRLGQMQQQLQQQQQQLESGEFNGGQDPEAMMRMQLEIEV
jgi:hypothetical protein